MPPPSTELASRPSCTSCRPSHPLSCLALGGRLLFRRLLSFYHVLVQDPYYSTEAPATATSGATQKCVRAHASTYATPLCWYSSSSRPEDAGLRRVQTRDDAVAKRKKDVANPAERGVRVPGTVREPRDDPKRRTETNDVGTRCSPGISPFAAHATLPQLVPAPWAPSGSLDPPPLSGESLHRLLQAWR